MARFLEIRFRMGVSLVALTIVAMSCNNDNGSREGSGTDGSPASDAGGGGTSGGGDTERMECPLNSGPPYADSNCYNTQCPMAGLASLDPMNTPMGDCCNTVDIRAIDESMQPNQTYDIELAMLINKPQINPKVAAVADLIQVTQVMGADVTLIRIKNVPRSADITEPVPVTLEMNNGKVNCDGSFSFYGPTAAPMPVHDGPPSDSARWAKRSFQVSYNGFRADELFVQLSEDEIAQNTHLSWVPRWNADGIDYEQPVKFLNFSLKRDNNNYSCYGTLDETGAWKPSAKVTLFIPVAEAKSVKIPALNHQTMCGLMAKGTGAGDCVETQDQWEIQPTGYCDEQDRCWIGNANDAEYATFWEEFYSGESGCGAAHPCCDPAGLDATLNPCNAYFMRNSAVVAAINITEYDVPNASQAISYTPDCQ